MKIWVSSLYYIWKFSVSLNLFQNKTLKEMMEAYSSAKCYAGYGTKTID